MLYGVVKSPKLLRFLCFTAAEVIGTEPIGIRELLKIESDIPREFYSGKALDMGSIFDIR